MSDETHTPRKSRCPACNPLHGNGLRRDSARQVKTREPCALCKDTRFIDVEVAERYVSSINGVSVFDQRLSVTIGGGQARRHPRAE